MTMINRRALLVVLGGLAAAILLPPRVATATTFEDGARAFVISLSDRALANLTDKTIPRPERIARFRALFNEHFAVKSIGRWVLGRHWRKATKSERREYLMLFEDLLVVSYVDRFAAYASTGLKITRTLVQSEKVATVYSRIVQHGGTAVRIAWRIGRRGGAYKVADVVIEGTSMSNTMRSDFGSIIRRRGGKVAGLIEALREKTRSLKEATDS